MHLTTSHHITLNLKWQKAKALQTLYKHSNNLETVEMTPRTNVILFWFWRFDNLTNSFVRNGKTYRSAAELLLLLLMKQKL